MVRSNVLGLQLGITNTYLMQPWSPYLDHGISSAKRSPAMNVNDAKSAAPAMRTA
jgi:hypothetical protein